MQKKLFSLIVGICLFFALDAIGQTERQLIFFKDKAGTAFDLNDAGGFLSERALLRRQRQNIPVVQRDLPVSKVYLDSLGALGANVLHTTKWLNGALVEATTSVLDQISLLGFVAGSASASRSTKGNATAAPETDLGFPEVLKDWQQDDEAFYGSSFNQISMLGINQMHRKGFQGQGIHVAVMDAGFLGANQNPMFDSLFAQEGVLGTYDFVDREEDVYDDHRHGMQVLSAMAGYSPGGLIGAAPKASYWLLRTENVREETRQEEFFWLVAAEFADSAGVDIIASSLGYNLFDNPAQSYTYAQMDGKTALISQAATMAAATGMLVVVSAGNEGNDSWRHILAPGDADSVLTVGAVNQLGEYAAFSSVGPTADGRIKPDVVARGLGTILSGNAGNIVSSNGTSFAVPLIAGLAAGVWQAAPELTNLALIEAIRQSGSQANAPDSLLGFGVPSFDLALVTHLENPNSFLEKIRVYPNPLEGNMLTLRLPPQAIGKPCQISVLDLQGKTLFQRNLKADKEEEIVPIYAPLLPQKVYILQIVLGNSTETFKLLKK